VENYLCIISRCRQTVIDGVDESSKLTWCYGKSIDQCREEYPDAEFMRIDAFCEWKAAQQRSPISWEEVTEAYYDTAFGDVPPARIIGPDFLTGEPWDHDALSGEPRCQALRVIDGVFYRSSRPITMREFEKEVR
jgi:hypothetical protein